MLLPEDINPINTVYYNGALVSRAIEQDDQYQIDFFDLYNKVKQKQRFSFQSYMFALDWLYLLGSIKIGTDGRVEKCF